jgi:hypothetical protein
MPKRDASDILPHLRRELKKRWPAIKFSVRRHRGTAYGWAGVSYTDGPSQANVEAACYSFQSSQFDGMDDSYHRTGHELPEGCYGLQGVIVDREYSDQFTARIAAEAIKKHPELAPFLTPENIARNEPDWPRRAGGGYAHPYAIIRTLGEDRTATLWHLLPEPERAAATA